MRGVNNLRSRLPQYKYRYTLSSWATVPLWHCYVRLCAPWSCCGRVLRVFDRVMVETCSREVLGLGCITVAPNVLFSRGHQLSGQKKFWLSTGPEPASPTCRISALNFKLRGVNKLRHRLRPYKGHYTCTEFFDQT